MSRSEREALQPWGDILGLSCVETEDSGLIPHEQPLK